MPHPAAAPRGGEELERAGAELARGETLEAVLARLGLSPNERARVVQALGRAVNLRRILPGECVEVGREPGGRLREVLLRRSPRLSLVVRLSTQGEASVETIEREAQLFLLLLEGLVDGSLYEAMIEAGGDAELVMRFADLFAWQVDFLTEPREGDTFRILVERERLEGEDLGFRKILAAEYRGRKAAARAVRYVDARGVRDWYDDGGRSVRRAFLKSPLNFRRISSRFSARRRHPVLKTVQPHWGVDYAAPAGTPVSALGEGIVRVVGRNRGLGNYVEIRHNATYTTCYGHLSRFARGLRRGVRVKQGQVIGYVGSTGLATGPHLDFRIKRRGRYVDPLRVESPPGRSVPRAEMERFARVRDRLWRLVGEMPAGEEIPSAEAWGRVPPRIPRTDIAVLAP